MARADVEAARAGDARAFELLLAAEVDGVYRLALAIVGNEADAGDVTQDVLVTAWRELPKLRDVARFDVWLRRVVVNAARMHLRAQRRRRIREIAVPDAEGEAGSPATDPLAGRPDALVLRDALGRVDPDRRSLLALHYLEGRPIGEIATILGVPAGTVKSRLAAARAALHAELRREGEP